MVPNLEAESVLYYSSGQHSSGGEAMTKFDRRQLKYWRKKRQRWVDLLVIDLLSKSADYVIDYDAKILKETCQALTEHIITCCYYYDDTRDSFNPVGRRDAGY
jgi:hypothetical protein